MKHSVFALPALLRPAYLLAAASQHSFSVNDDLFAYPQYEVRFSEDWVSESNAQSRLDSNALSPDNKAQASDIEHYRASSEAGTSDGPKKKEDPLTYTRMLLDKQPYLCSIPQVSKPEAPEIVNDTLSAHEREQELARANDRGWELLSGMQGNCVYFISGWWSYRFCYNEGVRQFHQLPPSRGVPVYPPVEDPNVEGYTLGMYQKEGKDGTKDKAAKVESEGTDLEVGSKTPGNGELVQRGDTRYLVQKLEGGTKCDLTGKPRKIDVQFHCNPSTPDRISLIKETSTCAYLMIIHTPRLCSDVAFLPPQKDEPNPISCSPILAEEQVDDYERDVSALKQAEEEAAIWAADPDAADVFLGEGDPVQIAGDIVVGARQIVPEGVTLEKSAVVGGGKETYIDTVASSDGKVLRKEDLEKLGLGDAKSLDRLKKQLEQMAGGQEWKLDVIETPRGREYRGTIGKDDEDEGEGKEGKGKKGEGKGGEGKAEGEGEGESEDSGTEGSEEEYFREDL